MFLRRCAFLAFWLVLGLSALRHPERAAETIKALVGLLAALADGLARFASAF